MGLMMPDKDQPADKALPDPEERFSYVKIEINGGLDEKPPPRTRQTAQDVGHGPHQVEPGLMGESDNVDIADVQTGDVQTVIDRRERKTLGMLVAIKPFLLDKGDKLPVDQKAGGRVVRKTIDTQNIQSKINPIKCREYLVYPKPLQPNAQTIARG